jgi:hypothetical protein
MKSHRHKFYTASSSVKRVNYSMATGGFVLYGMYSLAETDGRHRPLFINENLSVFILHHLKLFDRTLKYLQHYKYRGKSF